MRGNYNAWKNAFNLFGFIFGTFLFLKICSSRGRKRSVVDELGPKRRVLASAAWLNSNCLKDDGQRLGNFADYLQKWEGIQGIVEESWNLQLKYVSYV